MLRTRRPLQEKMTLFRHGHLTSGLRKVNDPNVHSTQNRFFRQGVGYPNPNRSHFRSMDIWQTAVAPSPAAASPDTLPRNRLCALVLSPDVIRQETR